MRNTQNNNINSIISVIVCLILITSLIQIIPNKIQIINEASADSTWIQSTKMDFCNGTLNNITINTSSSEAQLELQYFDKWINKFPSGHPEKRDSHAMATFYDTDKILLFGGSFRGTVPDNNETWVYDLSDNKWTQQKPSYSPSARTSHAMAMIYNTDKIVLYGGFQSGGINDTWVYDLSDNKWTLMNPETKPPHITCHCMAPIYNDDKVVMFGGYYYDGNFQYYNDTWVYDFSDNLWYNMNPQEPPPARCETGMAAISSTDKIILFGGNLGEFNRSDDTWVYDFSDNQWTEMNPISKPTTRDNHAMATICNDDKIMLFGAHGFNMYGWETWIYDLSESEWTKLDLNTEPTGRFDHALASIYNTKKIVMFGGYQGDEDTWLFDLEVEEPHYATSGNFTSMPYDTGGYVIYNSLEWLANTLNNTSIKFQLRTADDQSELYKKRFLGPDGETDTYYLTSGNNIWKGHNSERWVQCKAYLSINETSKSPILKEIKISFNYLPELEFAKVTPVFGNITTQFNFTTEFIDKDNDKPLFVNICIDGINYSMDESNITDVIISDGKSYWYSTKLKAGNHTYQFFASDSNFICSTNLQNLKVNFGQLSHIIIEPSLAKITIYEYQIFRAKGFDADGNYFPITPTWNVNGGGLINQFGNFTPTTSGIWIVYANSSGISGTASITVIRGEDDSNIDSDNDKIPDYWEQKYGLNITDPKDAGLDFDEDNLTNLEEYLNHTNPFDTDTDNDSFIDGLEVDMDTDPLDDKDYPIEEDEDKEKKSDKKDYSIYVALIGIIIVILILLALYINLKRKKEKK